MTLRKLFTAVALSFSVLGASAGRADWMEAKTGHFIVYGDMSQDKLLRFAKKIQAFGAGLRTIVKADKDMMPVTIFLVDDISAIQKLYGGTSKSVAGFYHASAQSAVAVAPKSTNSILDADQILLHEYAHHMLLANADQFYPGWVSEGLAEFFMTAIFKSDGGISFGAQSQARSYSLLSMNRFSAKELLESDARILPDNVIDQRYSRGWLLVHYLLLSGQRKGQLTKYVELLNSGMSVRDAARETFGDLNALDRELDRYMSQRKFSGFNMTPADLDKSSGDIRIRALTPAEAAMMPVQLVSANGVTKATAPRVATNAQAIAARYPGDAFVQRSLAEAEYDADHLDAAEAAADRALGIDPANIMGLVYKGRVIAKRAQATNDPQLWKSARSWFLKANKANPNYPLPFVLCYDSFVAAGQTAPDGAVSGLLRAMVLVPQDEQLRIRVAYALMRQGDMTTARRVLAGVAFDPHANGKGAGIKVIELIDAKASKEDILAQAKKEKFDLVNEFLAHLDDEKDGKEKGDKTSA